jgi:hypothetical protein
MEDLLLRAKYLFFAAMMASAPTGEPVQQAAFRRKPIISTKVE